MCSLTLPLTTKLHAGCMCSMRVCGLLSHLTAVKAVCCCIQSSNHQLVTNLQQQQPLALFLVQVTSEVGRQRFECSCTFVKEVFSKRRTATIPLSDYRANNRGGCCVQQPQVTTTQTWCSRRCCRAAAWTGLCTLKLSPASCHQNAHMPRMLHL